MFGKIFQKTFTGSMVGMGPVPFAVWAYVIAFTGPDHLIELNPVLIAAAIGCPVEEVSKALELFTSPDPRSSNGAEEGRRLLHRGAFQYFVVTHESHRNMRSNEELRAYNREAQREHRERVKERQAAARERQAKRQETPSASVSGISSDPSSPTVLSSSKEEGAAPRVKERQAASRFSFEVAGKGGPTYAVPQDLVDELVRLYPAVNVETEIEKAAAKMKRGMFPKKTASGMPKFLHGWMERTQNHARGGGGNGAARSTDPDPERPPMAPPGEGLGYGARLAGYEDPPSNVPDDLSELNGPKKPNGGAH